MIPWWAMACLGITNPNFQAWLFTILIQCIWECNQFCFEVPEWARLQKLEPGFISFKHKHSHLVWRLCLKMFYVDHKSKFSSKNFDPEFHATCDILVIVNKCIDMSTCRHQRVPLLQSRHTINHIFNYETGPGPDTQTKQRCLTTRDQALPSTNIPCCMSIQMTVKI